MVELREKFLRAGEAGLAVLIFLGGLVLGAILWNSPLRGQAPEAGMRFETLEVYVDSGARPLAAFQVELRDPTRASSIVGIEGGEHAAFKEPPYYDPAAKRQNRVILAGLSTSKDLPVGRTRVARVHLEVRDGARPDFESQLTTAASRDGELIPATIQIGGRN